MKKIDKTTFQKHITIYGAQSLNQFTQGVLTYGFEEYLSKHTLPVNSKIVIYQIHGSPQAEDEDRAFLQQIRQAITQKSECKYIILLHRPDEIQIRFPELAETLKEATRLFGLVFLGNMHIHNKCFSAKYAIKRIIPHGFFEELSEKLQLNPIVVGSNTSWGEMRSISHLFKLLGYIFRQKDSLPIVGYVGGKPKNQLQIDVLRKQWTEINHDVQVEFINAHDSKKFTQDVDKKNSVIVDSENILSDALGLTYNVQLYYLNGMVRTGESSGSAHASISIPVIFEMNGSEILENLQFIKVPYGSRGNLESADFEEGAKKILASIKNGSTIEMLQNNLTQSKIFTPSYVAGRYIELSEDIKV